MPPIDDNYELVGLHDVNELKLAFMVLDQEMTISLTTITEPTWKTVKDNPWVGRVKKTVQMKARVNADYPAEVNRNREANGLPGDSVPGPRPWGKRIGHSPFINDGSERSSNGASWTNLVQYANVLGAAIPGVPPLPTPEPTASRVIFDFGMRKVSRTSDIKVLTANGPQGIVAPNAKAVMPPKGWAIEVI
ncbi:MAG: hypothetical protein EBW47_00555 [Betaproteobacteria bacterium]|nr:hypothetical protein [Betaproteobacteria bacterium]